MTTSTGAMFTCVACHVAFPSANLQRDHFHSDWHRYNLKRRVASLPPVSSERFAEKVLEQRQKSKQEQELEEKQWCCDICGKEFGGEGMWAQHMESKKHKERLNAVESGKRKPAKVRTEKGDGAMEEKDSGMVDIPETEEQLAKLMEEKLRTAPRLSSQECLFCSYASTSIEQNVQHMESIHGLCIPDKEYIVDLAGLLSFLGEKVSVTNVCLWCNGRGRGLRSMEAVRRHMLDKGHTQIAYDTEEDRAELAEYYDYRPSYPDYDPNATDATADADLKPASEIVFGDTEYELVLPSGARIGHRSLQLYYKQRITLEDSDEEARVGRSADTKALTLRKENELKVLAKMSGPLLREAKKGGAKDKEVQREFDARIGMKANKLQRHFRAQILF